MIKDTLYAFHNDSATIENHRFRSWEQYYYSYFRDSRMEVKNDEIVDHASLYLTNWNNLAERLLSGNTKLRETYAAYLPVLVEMNGQINKVVKLNETLTSKIVSGGFWVVPTFDCFFREAAGFYGINKQLIENSFEQFSSFFKEATTEALSYTPMKVMDMYFGKREEVLTNSEDSESVEHVKEVIPEMKVMDMYFGKGKEEFTNTEDSQPVEHVKEVISDKKETLEDVTKIQNVPVSKIRKSRTDDIRNYITIILQAEKESGQDFALVCARDIHNGMALKNSYPSVCSAMASIPLFRRFDVVYAPPGGKSSKVTYRYILNGESEKLLQ